MIFRLRTTEVSVQNPVGLGFTAYSIKSAIPVGQKL